MFSKKSCEAKAIVRDLKAQWIDIREFVDDAILSSIYPYSPMLSAEVQNVLSKIADKTISQEDLRTLVSRTMQWAKRHHVRDSGYICDLMLHFDFAGVDIYNLSDFSISTIGEVQRRICEYAPGYVTRPQGLGQVMQDVLSFWGRFWDCDFAYDLLISCAISEEILIPFSASKTLICVKGIEDAYIETLLKD